MATVLRLDEIWQSLGIYLSDRPKNNQIGPQGAHGAGGEGGDSIWFKAFRNMSSEAAAAARDEVNAASQRGLEMI